MRERTSCFVLAAGVFSKAATLDYNRQAIYCSIMISNGVTGGRNISTEGRMCNEKADSDF